MIEKDISKQFTITIGQKDYEDLTDWAYAHGKTPAEYAAQILSARIEANILVIQQLRERNNRV